MTRIGTDAWRRSSLGGGSAGSKQLRDMRQRVPTWQHLPSRNLRMRQRILLQQHRSIHAVLPDWILLPIRSGGWGDGLQQQSQSAYVTAVSAGIAI